MPHAVRLQVEHCDAHSAARWGQLETPHGAVQTPAFMPVATVGAVKGVEVSQVKSAGAEMILANTYHLALRPGESTVAALGGLHPFTGWSGPILTDSGGFQIFSLAARTQIEEQSARFRSHIDGSEVDLSPERAVEIQETLGSDIAMVLDHVVALPNSRQKIEDAAQRSLRWAERCRHAARRSDQALFAIVQGGLEPDLRRQNAAALVELDFAGYAIGGLSVGEPPIAMYACLDATIPHLPRDRARYLMGVGRPIDLLEAIRRGVDLFDCVIPTRNGRNALAYTDRGEVRVRNRQHAEATQPLDPSCHCPACRHSLGYLRHLFLAKEMLGPMLLSLHNLTYYQRLMSDSRAAIRADAFEQFLTEKQRKWSEGIGSA